MIHTNLKHANMLSFYMPKEVQWFIRSNMMLLNQVSTHCQPLFVGWEVLLLPIWSGLRNAVSCVMQIYCPPKKKRARPRPCFCASKWESPWGNPLPVTPPRWSSSTAREGSSQSIGLLFPARGEQGRGQCPPPAFQLPVGRSSPKYRF